MLRIRLVLWYAFLVVMTVAAVGAIQYILLYRSLTSELDTALLDDARATLRLVETRTSQQLATPSATPKTNVPRSLTYFDREKITFDQDNDFDTKNAKAACYERYSANWADWRGLFGTPGV